MIATEEEEEGVASLGTKSVIAAYYFDDSDRRFVFRSRLYTFRDGGQRRDRDGKDDEDDGEGNVVDMTISKLPISVESAINEIFDAKSLGEHLDLETVIPIASSCPVESYDLIPGCTLRWSSNPSDSQFLYMPTKVPAPCYHGSLPLDGVVVSGDFTRRGTGDIRVWDEVSVHSGGIYINDRAVDMDGNVVYGKEIFDGKGPFYCDRVA